jgi:hypothetical protein
MTSEKVGGLECIKLAKLKTQFWLTNDPFGEFVLFGVKKYKFGWAKTQWGFWKA